MFGIHSEASTDVVEYKRLYQESRDREKVLRDRLAQTQEALKELVDLFNDQIPSLPGAAGLTTGTNESLWYRTPYLPKEQVDAARRVAEKPPPGVPREPKTT